MQSIRTSATSSTSSRSSASSGPAIVVRFAGALVLAAMAACGGSTDTGTAQSASTRSDRVVLDMKCSVDTDCPAGFQCETEAEHGTSTSACVSHKSGAEDATSGKSGGASSDDSAADDKNKPGSDDDAGAASTSGTGAAGAACTSAADCGAGLECEVDVEHGATTSTCQPHQSGGHGGGHP